MKIKIGDYLIESDSMQFVVKERRIAQEGKNKGEEYWTSPKYIVKFSDVLRYIPEQVLRTNDDIGEIRRQLDEIHDSIIYLDSLPVIYVRPEKQDKKNKNDFDIKEADKEIEEAIDEYINSDKKEVDFEKELQEIEKVFRENGYSELMIDDIKGNGDFEEQYNNLEEEQSNWGC